MSSIFLFKLLGSLSMAPLLQEDSRCDYCVYALDDRNSCKSNTSGGLLSGADRERGMAVVAVLESWRKVAVFTEYIIS